MKKKPKKEKTPKQVVSMFDENGLLKGEPLSRFNRPGVDGVTTGEEYTAELRKAREITHDDLSTRVGGTNIL
jgi:hypothetical protein